MGVYGANHPQLRESAGKDNKGYFFEALSAAVGPVEGELRIKVPEEYLPVTRVSPVDRFERDEKSGLWHAVGANRIQKALPPNGYQAEFDQDFYPTKTLPNREKAISALRDLDFPEEDAKHLASYFFRRNEYKNFAAVSLDWYQIDNGPRALDARWPPVASSGHLGVRAVERLPSAQREAGQK